MDETNNPARLNEKWIATVLWIALLALLYFTTTNSVLSGFGGNLRDFYQSVSVSSQMFEADSMAMVVAILSLLMGVALLYFLFRAWSQFVELTNTYLIAMVKRSEAGESNPIFFELLNFDTQKTTPENEDEPILTDPEDATGSMVGNILKAVAICWVIIILTPWVIAVVSSIVR